MSPYLFLPRCIEPGLDLLPRHMASDEARVMLMACAGQETLWNERAQIVAEGPPPAVSYYQFEQIGVQGVLETSPQLARYVLAACDVPEVEAHQSLRYHDPLATAFARLLLYSSPAPLPVIGDMDGAYQYYIDLWRPGKPDESRWPNAYTIAVDVVCRPKARDNFKIWLKSPGA
jgi:hypothetical protein